jgi:hypothetical protein
VEVTGGWSERRTRPRMGRKPQLLSRLESETAGQSRTFHYTRSGQGKSEETGHGTVCHCSSVHKASAVGAVSLAKENRPTAKPETTDAI